MDETVQRITADARDLALEHGRRVLAGEPPIGSVPTFVLERIDGVVAVALLVSLDRQRALVAPLRQGLNVIARSEGIGDHKTAFFDGASARSCRRPVHWCEAAQCHIFCDRRTSNARAADRSSNGTFIFRRTRPIEEMRTFGELPSRFEDGPIPLLEGSWRADPRGWQTIGEGDVLVCCHANWVFGWVA